MVQLSDDSLNKTLQDLAQRLLEFTEAAQQIGQKVIKFLNENPGFLESILRFVEDGPQELKAAWEHAAMQGWYLPLAVPSSAIEAARKGGQALDTFMVNYLDEAWNDLTAKALTLYPKRAHILRVAFTLHQEKNYIASIPLFLSQIDGICAQHLGAYFFSERDKRVDSVALWIANSNDELVDSYLSALMLKTQIVGSIRNAAACKKANGPNRSGILHGSRKHLDYGTSINSYKALSLLFFMASCFDQDSP